MLLKLNANSVNYVFVRFQLYLVPKKRSKQMTVLITLQLLGARSIDWVELNLNPIINLTFCCLIELSIITQLFVGFC